MNAKKMKYFSRKARITNESYHCTIKKKKKTHTTDKLNQNNVNARVLNTNIKVIEQKSLNLLKKERNNSFYNDISRKHFSFALTRIKR